MNKNKLLKNITLAFENGDFEDTLRRRVTYQSVSQGNADPQFLKGYMEQHIKPELEGMGFECRFFENSVEGRAPFMVACRIEKKDSPTVLTYGHGDVVAGYDEQWTGDLKPWEMKLVGDAWYGRGTADNKGQHTINIMALHEVIKERNGSLGFNIKMIFEMGEEQSSPGLRQFCREQKELLASDVFIASDGPRISKESPTLFLGARGSILLELSVEPRQEGLHSGNWGGIVSNPVIVLSNAISEIVSKSGKILIPDLTPKEVPENIKTILKNIKIDESSLGQLIDSDWGEKELSLAEKLFAWNTFEVLAINAGDIEKPVNAIPPNAKAICQLRFVVGTNPEAIEKNIRKYFNENGFKDVSLKVLRGSPATRTSLDSQWVKDITRSVEEVINKPLSIIPNFGGALPNDTFSEILGLPTIWVPHSYPGCKQHAANEHLPKQLAYEGLLIMGSIFWELGNSKKTKTVLN
ncbi:M20 family metallopeptidase [Vreelandella sp. EE27]